MTLVTSLLVGLLVGCGVHMMGRRHILELSIGVLLLSNAAILLLISSGISATQAPLLPLVEEEQVSDPLVQALALTGVVIAFGTTVLLLRLGLAVARTHRTLDMSDLATAGPDEGDGVDPHPGVGAR